MDEEKKLEEFKDSEEIKEELEEEQEDQEEDLEIAQIKREDSAPNDMDQYITPHKKSGKRLLTVVAILVVVSLAAGIYFLLNNNQPAQTPKEESPVVENTPAPTATPEPLNRPQWSFEVLNGSGVSGEAKRVAEALKELGYVVTKTGNADKDTYEQSQIIIQKSLEDKINLVIADIKDIIRIASISATLSESTPSGRIIIGKE